MSSDADIVKYVHDLSGLGLEEFARRIEVHHSTVKRWKRGETHPSEAHKARMSDLVGQPFDSFLITASLYTFEWRLLVRTCKRYESGDWEVEHGFRSTGEHWSVWQVPLNSAGKPYGVFSTGHMARAEKTKLLRRRQEDARVVGVEVKIQQRRVPRMWNDVEV